eukprot:1612068-Karenia_brevis.AAC.1
MISEYVNGHGRGLGVLVNQGGQSAAATATERRPGTSAGIGGGLQVIRGIIISAIQVAKRANMRWRGAELNDQQSEDVIIAAQNIRRCWEIA